MEQTGTDELFEHMQELLGRLPAMQRLHDRVRLNNAGIALRDLQHQLQQAQSSLEQAQARLDEATRRFEEAVEAGDEAGQDRMSRELLFLGDQLGLCKGPVNTARFNIEQLLKESGLASLEEGIASIVDEGELRHLEEEIASYQQDYQRTLAACQEAESADEA